MKTKIIFWTIVLIFMLPVYSRAAPVFITPINNQTFNLVQNTEFSYMITASDTADNLPIDFTDDSADVNFGCFRKYFYNSTAFLINFTPENENVGYYDVHLTAKNNKGEAQILTMTVHFNVSNINDPPYLFSTGPINGSHVPENQTLALFVNANDPDLSYGDNLSFLWYLDGVLANASSKLNGTKINSTRSNATYSPISEDFDYGAHNISVAVKDNANASFNYTWVINVDNLNRPPVFNKTILNLTWFQDINLTNNFTLISHFYDLDTNGTQCEIDTFNCLEYDYDILSGNSSGIDILIDQASGNVSFHPSVHWYGIVNVIFSVYDGYNRTYSNNVTLIVTHINAPPVISMIPNQTTYANTYFSYHVNATDIENDNLSFSVFSAALTVINISSSGLIELESNSSHAGNHTVNVTVSDGINASSALFNLEILPHNRPYIIPFANLTVVQHSAYTIIINGSTDIIGNLLFSSNWSAINPGQMFNSTSWNFTFTINSQLMVGNHSVRIFVNDNVNSTNYYDCNIEVIDLDMPPALFSVFVPNNQIKVNTTFNKNVSAFDEEGGIVSFSDNSSLFNIITSDTGDMTRNALGLIVFTPANISYEVINISVIDTGSNINWTLFILNITDNHIPYFTVLNNITCNESMPCMQQVVAADYDWQDSLVYGTNATDFTIDSITGIINFIPINRSVYNTTIWVTDGTANISMEIIVNISKINHAPRFTENISLFSVWTNITENVTTSFNVTAVDVENDSIALNIHFINFTNLANATINESITLFNFTSFFVHPNNSVTAFINFTPNWTQSGTYTVNFSVSDNNSGSTYQLFNFFVHHTKSPPIVNWSLSYPYSSLYLNGSEINTTNLLNTTENTTIYINTTAFNRYYEPIHYSWLINSSGTLFEVENKSFINYTLPFYAYPNLTLILYVICQDNATTTIIWKMNVTNVNRQHMFGVYEYFFNSSDGTYNNTEIANESLIVSKKNTTEYYNSSSFISGQIDFKTTSLDLPRISYNNITLINADNNLGDYTIDVYTSTSNLLLDNSWIKAENFSINSSDYRYLWFRADIMLLNSSVSPLISKAVINYEIKNLSVAKDTSYAAWIDLDHFFHDLDTDDSLTYNYSVISGINLINVSIIQDHYIGISFLESGIAQVVFNATDQFGLSISSNIVNIEIISPPSQSTSSLSTRTVTKTITNTQYIFQEQPQPVFLDIIYPLNITIYKDETITVPILLKNKGDVDLTGIKIDAYAEKSGLNMHLDTTELTGLSSGTEKIINLYMNMTEVYDSYTVYVAVNVTDPKYDATAKIIISSLKKNQENKESETLKLAFVSDLLQRNEECAELTEYVTRAKEYLNIGDSKKAEDLLDKFINDCKILIKASKEHNDKPSLITGNLINIIKGNTDYLIITIAIITLIVVTTFIVLFNAYRKI